MTDLLPVLPLKNAVAYPYVILQLSVGRDGSLAAVEAALAKNRELFLVAQRQPEVEEPEPKDLFDIGTVAALLRLMRLPEGPVRILAQGLSRARVTRFRHSGSHLGARVRLLEDTQVPPVDLELEATIRAVKQKFGELLELGKEVAPEVRQLVITLTDPGRLADLLASNLDLSIEVAQELLAELDPARRLKRIAALLGRERELFELEHQIASRARDDVERSQRELFLRQQLRTIQAELGEGSEQAEEIRRLRAEAEQRNLPPLAFEELERQLKRLERLHPDSSEAAVQRTYLEWIVSLPWAQRSDDSLDLQLARIILNREHWGLEDVKERILESLAVRKLRPQGTGSVLCFVGPPGVGKSSLARSIARALNRRFVRWSLGGVHDEAEVRGHRRTYVGALPGRILQGLVQAGTSNPVFLLDELDKLGREPRGDPQAALLEVLDPELNSAFRDHYLGLPYDLSGVFWIATANWLEPLDPALRDRLEVLEIPAYTLPEKIAIARRHLLPRQLERCGLEKNAIRLTKNALQTLIEDYTREAGVRQLEREIERLARKLAMAQVTKKPIKSPIGIGTLRELFGPPLGHGERLPRADQVGVAVGLAWTPTGGELLLVEALAHPGKGRLVLTGQLGEVLRESAQAALSFVRAWLSRLGFDDRFFLKHDIHLHFPSGAIPKDGPSAGLAVAAALVSLRTGRKLPSRLGWTGEITLRGEVLAVGGLRDKLLAAQCHGLRRVILPAATEPEVRRLPTEVTRGIDLRYVSSLEEALQPLALSEPPRRRSGSTRRRTSRPQGTRSQPRN